MIRNFIAPETEKTAHSWRNSNGHAIFKADRTKVTIQDVIAAESQREPVVDYSQRESNTGIVLVVDTGRHPLTI